MIRKPARLASTAALAAALSMAATPATALDLPAAAPMSTGIEAAAHDGDPGEANQYRRYRPYRDYRHRDRGVDAGDVIAGVAVLGVLAAVVASSRGQDRDREGYEPRRTDTRGYDAREYDSGGIENAVDMCVDEVEYSDNRVDDVSRADRNASGWTVSGTLENGQGWTCLIDNGGNIRSIDYGDSFAAAPVAPGSGQLSDAAYRNARAATRTPADTPYRYETAPEDYTTGADDPRPAYPGGPLPGEEGYDDDWQAESDYEGEPDAGEWEGDGRYDTAQAPDFTE